MGEHLPIMQEAWGVTPGLQEIYSVSIIRHRIDHDHSNCCFYMLCCCVPTGIAKHKSVAMPCEPMADGHPVRVLQPLGKTVLSDLLYTFS